MSARDSRWQRFRTPFLRSLIPIGLSYAFAIAGFYFTGHDGGADDPDATAGILGQTVLALSVALFTLSHAVVPVFFFRIFFFWHNQPHLLSTLAKQDIGEWFGLLFAFILVSGGAAGWVGGPIALFAYHTRGISAIPLVVHIVMARWGSKMWTFFEYGSTSFALLLFLGFSNWFQNPLPFGIFLAAMQIVLLTCLQRWGRPLWVEEPSVVGHS